MFIEWEKFMETLNTLQNKCLAQYEKCVVKAQELDPTIKRVQIVFNNRMTRTAGCFRIKNGIKSIQLSTKIMMLNPNTFMNTVIHEAAHQFVRHMHGYNGIAPHGDEWQDMMIFLGGNTKRCHSHKVPVGNGGRYIVKGQEFVLSTVRHNRCQAGTVYIASKEGVKYTIKKENLVR